MPGRTKYLVALAVAAIIVVVGFLFVRPKAPPPGPAPAPLAMHAAPPAGTPPSAGVAPANCLMPGPAPVPPDGFIATAADMKLGHDTIQAFVLQLEAFQACRDSQADHAPPGVTAAQKQAWIEDGDAAVDQANALAAAFKVQLTVFKAQHPGQ